METGLHSRGADRSIGELIAHRRPGHALEQGFYTRQDVFARDMDLLLSGWICVGHESEVPEAGDYLLAELEREAAEAGYRRVFLTTGPRQPEAVGLYLATGYTALADPGAAERGYPFHPFVKAIGEP